MNVIAAIVFLLFTSQSAAAAIDPRVAAILTRLPADVRLDSAVTTEVDTCGGLWRTNGLVCDKNKAVDLATDDAAKIAKAEMDFNAVLDRLVQVTKKEEIHSDKLDYKEDRDIVNWILREDFQSRMKSAGNQCWAKMSQIRSSSLCSVCSANNFQYFKDTKGCISLDECDKVLNSCSSFFSKIYRLMQLPRVFGSLALVSHSDGLNKKLRIEKFASLESKSGSHELAILLQKKFATEIGIKDKNSDEHSISICEKTIRLMEEPILTKLTAYFSRMMDLLEGFRSLTLLNHASRSLDGTTDLFGLSTSSLNFQGDVVVLKPTDNLFTSFVGAAPDMDLQNGGKNMPMNLSLAFP